MNTASAMARIRALIAEKKYEDAITLANAYGLGVDHETGHLEVWFKDLLKKQKKAYDERMGRLRRENTLPAVEFVGRIPSARYTNVPVGNVGNNDPTLRWARAVPSTSELWLPDVSYNEYSRRFFPERAATAGVGDLEAKMAALAPTVKPTGIKPGPLNAVAAALGFRGRRSKKSKRTRRSKYTLKRR